MRSGVELRPAALQHVRAGIVDQDVEPAELLGDRGRDAARGVLLAEIAGATSALPPALVILSATACSGSRRRPVSATAAPSRASASAAASPMPLPAPVTQATFPVRSGTAAYSTRPDALSIRCMWSRCAAIFIGGADLARPRSDRCGRTLRCR